MKLGDHKITKHVSWSDSSAKSYTHWKLWEVRRTFFRHTLKWKPVHEYSYDVKSPVIYRRPEQARAAAEHYGIEVEL